MKGFKAFNKDLTCRGYQYEIGKTFEMKYDPIICKYGFHFCLTISDCYNYYHPDSNGNVRICEVEAVGKIDHNDRYPDKYCTNKIHIIREVTDKALLHQNKNGSTIGFYNTGDWNTGNRNTGDWNTGNRNTGNRNTGDCNTGNRNTGDYNTGNYNTGNYNTGNYNTGNYNTGDWNTGDWNTGDCNTGDWNTGDWNTGDWNTTINSTGCFNTKESTIKLFNKDSSLTLNDWRRMNAYFILCGVPSYNTYTIWIPKSSMSDEEKEKYSTYKTTSGYLKEIKDETPRQKWWNKLSDKDKEEVMNIPNFDPDIFYECTGIKVAKNS